MDLVQIRMISGACVSIPVHGKASISDLKCNLATQVHRAGRAQGVWKLLYKVQGSKAQFLPDFRDWFHGKIHLLFTHSNLNGHLCRAVN